MKILTQTIEVFFSNDELNNDSKQVHSNKYIKEGYKYKEGYCARLDGVEGFICIYEKSNE